MDVVFEHLDLFWSGYLRSVAICLWALGGSLIIGVLLAAMRVSPLPPLRATSGLFVTLMMNTPLAVVLFFVAFGLPEIGLNSSYFVLGISGLVIYTSAFICESVRSGVNAVSIGQTEAARSIGMSTTQTLVTIVIPQSVRAAVPPLSNTIISMFTNSAVVGAFGVGGDLFAASGTLTSALGYPNLPVLIGISVGYLAITIPTAILLRAVERKVAILR